MKKQTTIIILILSLFILASCKRKEALPTETKQQEDYIDDILEAYNYHLNANYFYVTGNGSITSSLITQDVKVIKYKDENELYYFNASYGSGKFNLEVKNYVEATGTYDNLHFEKGSSTKDLTKEAITFFDDFNHDHFVNLYGLGIDDINYLLSYETIEKIEKINGIYILELDLVKSVQKYIKHINETNPYEAKENKTKFHSITLEIKLDENNRFREIVIFETYEVGIGMLIKPKLTAKIIEQYFYEKEGNTNEENN